MKTWIDWTSGKRLVFIEWTCRKCKQTITVSSQLRGDAELHLQHERARHVCQQQVGGGK